MIKKIVKNIWFKIIIFLSIGFIFLPINVDTVLYFRFMIGFYFIYESCNLIDIYFYNKRLNRGDKNETIN